MALPTIRRLFYAINLSDTPEDFLQVNEEEITIPLNYLRPYKNKISNDLFRIPLDSILKVYYLDQVARGQERHILIHYSIANSEENKLFLYNCEFINGQEDIDAFYEFFVGKVPTERMEFLR